jgi:hypothetical protein
VESRVGLRKPSPPCEKHWQSSQHSRSLWLTLFITAREEANHCIGLSNIHQMAMQMNISLCPYTHPHLRYSWRQYMIVLKDRKIARNPVARAVAAQQLKKRMVDQRIQLFMLEEGVDARSSILPISDAVFIMSYALELVKQEDSSDYRKLKSAMLVLVNCSERKFVWHKADTITIDNAIEICVNRWTQIPTDKLHHAMNHILGTMK